LVPRDEFRALEAEFSLLKRQFLACDDPLERQELLKQVSLLVSKISRHVFERQKELEDLKLMDGPVRIL
jgi:hypothetical protein